MKKLLLFAIALLSAVSAFAAADTVSVWKTQIPILIERQDNMAMYLRYDAKRGGDVVNEIELEWSQPSDLRYVEAVRLYYGGTRAVASLGRNVMYPYAYMQSTLPGNTMSALPSLSVLKGEIREQKAAMRFPLNQPLTAGAHFFWVSVQLKSDAPLSARLHFDCKSVKINGYESELRHVSGRGAVQRAAIGVRHAGDDDAAAFRIPGIVTTSKGTLLAVYDVRYDNSVDLQGRIDVGLSRSTDGGRSWDPMRIPLSFSGMGGLPDAQNGVGDPCILYDEKSKTTWIAAIWTHGMAGQRAWNASKPGMTHNETAQLMLTKSTDDGRTWSEPINITSQVKHPDWHLLLQGPGRGITMADGTLAFPIQYIRPDRIPCAGVMYSRDGGKTWTIRDPARENTTEAQVVEIEPGVLMLNMRDNRGGSRAVSITRDLGKTWTEHVSSRSALQEPVCMASLLNVSAADNTSGRDILLFSNPNTVQKRHHITIKASLDGGVTWLKEHQVLLDEAQGWGYSCLTMVDERTIGILYESSAAHMTFQTISLDEILGK